MFRTEEETLAIAHLWAISVYYEGVQDQYGLFATQEQVQAFIDADEWLSGQSYPVPMALPVVS
jgi:hypothetical protein